MWSANRLTWKRASQGGSGWAGGGRFGCAAWGGLSKEEVLFSWDLKDEPRGDGGAMDWDEEAWRRIRFGEIRKLLWGILKIEYIQTREKQQLRAEQDSRGLSERLSRRGDGCRLTPSACLSEARTCVDCTLPGGYTKCWHSVLALGLPACSWGSFQHLSGLLPCPRSSRCEGKKGQGKGVSLLNTRCDT